MKNFSKSISIVAFIVFLLFANLEPCFSLQSVQDNVTIAEQSLNIKDNRIEMPLRSVILLGLKNNLNIKFASYSPQISQTNIQAEQGKFDTLLKTQYQKTRSCVANQQRSWQHFQPRCKRGTAQLGWRAAEKIHDRHAGRAESDAGRIFDGRLISGIEAAVQKYYSRVAHPAAAEGFRHRHQ